MSLVTLSHSKEFAFRALMIGLGFGLSPSVFAQTKGMAYNGPRANINVYQKGFDGDFSFCEKDPQARISKDTYAACVNAISGAKTMAENCAQGQGEIDGYRRGYSWGFNSALNYAQKDASQYNSGKQSIYRDTNTAPFIQRQVINANANTFNEGVSRGASLAIQRFTDFVDTGASRAGGVPSSLLPNPIPVPAHGSPYQNPYLSLLPGQFQSIDALIDRAQFDANQIKFVNRYDSVWGVSRPQWSVRVLYSSDGIYNPNSVGGCMNVQDSFGRWTSNDRMGKGVYSGYAKGPSVAKDGSIPGARPADGRPTRDEPATKGEVTKGDVANGVPAPAAPNYQAIYASAFRWAYQNYANFYYSQGFYRNLDLGQFYGDSLGRQVGSEYAFQTGRRDAFNELFFQAESNEYSQQAVNGYDSGFQNKYREYMTNPQPAFEFVDVVGEVDDGIIQPNENFSVRVRVKNYGAVATRFTAQLAGNVTDVKGFTLNAPALSSQVITSPIAARVATASGSNARVVLQVAGRELPISQYVTDQVTPTAITYEASIPAGLVKVTVTVVNHSNKKSYDGVKVNLNDNFGHKLEQNVGFLEAGQTLPVTFTVSELDPLALIDGRVTVQSQTLLGATVVGTQQAQISSSNASYDLAKYFDLLVQDGAKQDKISLVHERLVSIIDAETDEISDNKYSDQDDDYTTVLYSVRAIYKSHAQSTTAKRAFSKLANDFRKHNHIGGLRFQQKSRFKKAVNEIGS